MISNYRYMHVVKHKGSSKTIYFGKLLENEILNMFRDLKRFDDWSIQNVT